MRNSGSADIEWRVAAVPVPYATAIAGMEARAAAVADGGAAELIWLLEHPPVITAGTSSRAVDLRQPDRFPVCASGRGGRHTYHGPGQRIVYPILDLDRRGRDIRHYVCALEGWIVDALHELGIAGRRDPAGTGVWLGEPPAQRKIAAIGIRVRRWVTYHGFAINVANDLTAYEAIIPCGIADHGVTRLVDHRPQTSLTSLDKALARTLPAFLDRLSSCPAGRTNPLEGRTISS